MGESVFNWYFAILKINDDLGSGGTTVCTAKDSVEFPIAGIATLML